MHSVCRKTVSSGVCTEYLYRAAAQHVSDCDSREAFRNGETTPWRGSSETRTPHPGCRASLGDGYCMAISRQKHQKEIRVQQSVEDGPDQASAIEADPKMELGSKEVDQQRVRRLEAVSTKRRCFHDDCVGCCCFSPQIVTFHFASHPISAQLQSALCALSSRRPLRTSKAKKSAL